MSGGRFDYKQYHISEIADELENIILNNDSEEKNRWGDPIGLHFPTEVITKLKEGVRSLRIAAVYAQRADWLLSGDDGEDSFLRRLEEELKALECGEDTC